LRRLLGENISLMTRLLPDLWPVKVDPGQIEQVLVNLVVNARDAMPDGGTVTITTDQVRVDKGSPGQDAVEPGAYVLLTVSDTGGGIAADIQPHIFEPFFTTKGPEHGSGLGLATCYGIVTQHGGAIHYASTPGQGTSFRVYLPRSLDMLLPTQPQDSTVLPHGTETILLVEDDPAVRGLTMRMLRTLGYVVVEASDGEAALARLHALTPLPDLILTDVRLPRVSGPQLAVVVHERYGPIKVLFMSGYHEHEVRDATAPTIRSTVIQKPFTADVLARRVRALLDSQDD
jgi:CheY-like chemotaxis protein